MQNLHVMTPGGALDQILVGDVPSRLQRHTRPYTKFSYKVYQNLKSYTGILKIGAVPYTKIVKIDTVAYTNMWEIDTIPNGTSPYPKYT